MIKYIFCINPGRTGSEYISRLFSSVQGVSSFHEPKPILHGHEMQQYLMGNPAPLDNIMHKKLEAIRDSLKGNTYYFEANHCFVKGFGWLLPKYVSPEEIGVIVLKRRQKPVVDSLYKVHAHPFTTTGEKYIIVPQFYKNNRVPYPDEYNVWSFYFYKIQYRIVNRLRKILPVTMPPYVVEYAKKLIKWYVEETYSLGEAYLEKFKGIKSVELDLEELNSLEGFKRLLAEFGIPIVFREDMNNVIGKKVNEREHAALVK